MVVSQPGRGHRPARSGDARGQGGPCASAAGAAGCGIVCLECLGSCLLYVPASITIGLAQTPEHEHNDTDIYREQSKLVRAHTFKDKRTHTDTHARTHTHMHARIHTHTSTNTNTHTHKHSHTHTHTHTHTYTHTHTHTHTHIHTDTQTQTHTDTHNTRAHTHTEDSFSCPYILFVHGRANRPPRLPRLPSPVSPLHNLPLLGSSLSPGSSLPDCLSGPSDQIISQLSDHPSIRASLNYRIISTISLPPPPLAFNPLLLSLPAPPLHAHPHKTAR